jgi:hypothetical protein
MQVSSLSIGDGSVKSNLDPVEPESGRAVGAWKAHQKARAHEWSQLKSKSKESVQLPLDPVVPEIGRPVGKWKAHRRARASERSKLKSKESAGLPKVRKKAREKYIASSSTVMRAGSLAGARVTKNGYTAVNVSSTAISEEDLRKMVKKGFEVAPAVDRCYFFLKLGFFLIKTNLISGLFVGQLPCLLMRMA